MSKADYIEYEVFFTDGTSATTEATSGRWKGKTVAKVIATSYMPNGQVIRREKSHWLYS